MKIPNFFKPIFYKTTNELYSKHITYFKFIFIDVYKNIKHSNKFVVPTIEYKIEVGFHWLLGIYFNLILKGLIITIKIPFSNLLYDLYKFIFTKIKEYQISKNLRKTKNINIE